MIDDSKYIIRKATLDDVDFLVTTIIEAEKSSTNNLGLANYFEVTEEELRQYLKDILEEEIDGCELSVSSFIVAEYEGQVVSTRGGWLEGHNEDEQPSSVLKSNLIQFHFPMEKVLNAQKKWEIVKDIQVEREWGTYQWEYSYTIPEHRGHHLVPRINEYHIHEAKKLGAKKIQGHVFANNIKSIKAYERSGFNVVKRYTSSHPLTKEYYPDDTVLLLEKEL
jgi:ribosomal protein S18 acetylase RimI-like enzyme